MAQELSSRLGQPVVVENKTAAMGVIGTTEVTQARPDGHALLGIGSGFCKSVIARIGLAPQ